MSFKIKHNPKIGQKHESRVEAIKETTDSLNQKTRETNIQVMFFRIPTNFETLGSHH